MSLISTIYLMKPQNQTAHSRMFGWGQVRVVDEPSMVSMKYKDVGWLSPIVNLVVIVCMGSNVPSMSHKILYIYTYMHCQKKGTIALVIINTSFVHPQTTSIINQADPPLTLCQHQLTNRTLLLQVNYLWCWRFHSNSYLDPLSICPTCASQGKFHTQNSRLLTHIKPLKHTRSPPPPPLYSLCNLYMEFAIWFKILIALITNFSSALVLI